MLNSIRRISNLGLANQLVLSRVGESTNPMGRYGIISIALQFYQRSG